jgi:hypothetical protein
LFLTFPLLKIEAALSQIPQPRQTPTQTTTKPVNKTPTVTERSRSATPILKPVTPVDDSGETPTSEETTADPEEAEQKANDLDNKISPSVAQAISGCTGL